MLGFDAFHTSNCRGFVGGIVAAWKSNSMTVTVLRTEFQFIHMKIKFADEDDWLFTAVYASPRDELCRELWRDLYNIGTGMPDAWLIASDFNDIATPTEKKAGAPVCLRKCQLFSDRINNCNLLDLGAIGSNFTWRGPLFNGQSRIFERLDLALSNSEWRIRFSQAVVKVLPRVGFSDHHPLLVMPSGVSVRPREPKFRFENSWTTHPTYHDMVLHSWSAGGTFTHHLQSLEGELKQWKVHTFGLVRQRKREPLARLGGIQRVQSAGNMNKFLEGLEKSL